MGAFSANDRMDFSASHPPSQTPKFECPTKGVIKALRSEHTFSKDLLSSIVSEAEAKCNGLQKQFEAAQSSYEEGQTVLRSLEAQYDDIISWADMYDSASLEAKKMIVNCLIKRLEVYRDYKLHITFNIDFEQFILGLDILTFPHKQKIRFLAETDF